MILDRLHRRVPLYFRLVIGIAVVLLMVDTATVYLSTIKALREYRRDIKEEIDVTLSVLEQELSQQVIIGDFATIEEILRNRVRREHIKAAAWKEEGIPPLVARDGSSAASRPEWFALQVKLDHPEASRDLVIGGVTYGKITVAFDSVPMENRLWQSVLLNIGMLTTMLALMAFFLVLALRKSLSPLSRLDESARHIGAGNLSTRVTEFPGDAPEMRMLIGTFNRMAENAETMLMNLSEQRRAIDNATLVTETDLGGTITYANEKFCALTGYRGEDLLGRPHNIIISGEQQHSASAGLWQAILAGQEWNGEVAIRTRQGEPRWLATTATPVLGADGNPVKFVAIHLDVSELKLIEQKLRQSHEELEQKVAERTKSLEIANKKLATLSNTDGLTGIANRRRFDKVLASEWHRAIRARQPLALLMIDVDLFKNYNDHYGHLVGDDCLSKVAGVLQASSRRASDLVARYGGEEFVLVATDTDARSALQLAEVVRAATESLGLPHARSPFEKVTVSIGVAVMIPDNTQEPELLIQKADCALYRAKNQGRNRVDLSDLL